MEAILPIVPIVGSDTSQADGLHTDMTFDLASSGFGVHDEITQDQGQSRTKAGSLTEEVVIGGRSRSQEATTNLWVNFAGYGNWTESSSSGWSETVSDYEFSRRIDNSYWYGRQSDQVTATYLVCSIELLRWFVFPGRKSAAWQASRSRCPLPRRCGRGFQRGISRRHGDTGC